MRFTVSALGTPVGVELSGFSETDAAIIRAAWARTITDESAGVTVRIQPPAIGELSQRITAAAAPAGLVLEAGAVADSSGGVVALIGSGVTTAITALASTRGPTHGSTLGPALGPTLGYVSDELIALDGLQVAGFAAPLAIASPGSRRKRSAGPDTLGLASAPAQLGLRRIVVLDRQPNGPGVPAVTPLEFAEAVEYLVPLAAGLEGLEAPLLSLVAASGGIARITYREAADLVGMLPTDAVDPEAWKPVPPVPGEGGMRRAAYDDAITDGRRVIVLRAGAVRVIDGVGSIVWLAAVGTTIDEVVAIVTARFGTPPTGTPRGHVDDAVVQLRAAGVLE